MMGGSPMVIMWPSRDEDGSYASVTLSQRKAPFEVTEEHPQLALTQPAPPDGCQEIILAFSRTSPESADENVPISICHWFGRGVLNLTHVPITADADMPPPSPLFSVPDVAASDDGGGSDAKIDESEWVATGKSGGDGHGGFASFLHAALCFSGSYSSSHPVRSCAIRKGDMMLHCAYDLHRTFHVSEMRGVSDSKQTLLTMWMEGYMRMV
ncbi:hypothetical protein BGW80DRAFT_439716 [Lactifluus volemus]|nr:hypothetical protein BGW80DRAFT_439716 [Lactifluus volemus]